MGDVQNENLDDEALLENEAAEEPKDGAEISGADVKP